LTDAQFCALHGRVKALAPPLALCAALVGYDAPRAARERSADAPGASTATRTTGRGGARGTGDRVARAIAARRRGARTPDGRAGGDRDVAGARAGAGRASWRSLRISSPRGPQGFGFTLVAQAPGRTLTLHGSRLATLLPDVGRHEGTERLRGLPAFVTDNDGFKSATRIEHGAACTLDLECASARAPGCDLAALRAEVEALVYVGRGGR